MDSRFAPGQPVEVRLSDAPWNAATVLSVEPSQHRSWGPEQERWTLRYTVQMNRTGAVFAGRYNSEIRSIVSED